MIEEQARIDALCQVHRKNQLILGDLHFQGLFSLQGVLFLPYPLWAAVIHHMVRLDVEHS